MKLLVDANNLLSVLTGGSRDYDGMKERVRKGYEGEYSDHVHQYDERGYHLQIKSARYQLEDIRLDDMQVWILGVVRVHYLRSQLKRGQKKWFVGIYLHSC